MLKLIGILMMLFAIGLVLFRSSCEIVKVKACNSNPIYSGYFARS